MPEEQKKPKKPETPEELRQMIEKKERTVDYKEMITQLATRDILEDDYKKEILDVVFQSTPGVNRKIKVKRPTAEQITEMMKLSAEAALYETRLADNPKIAERILGIYEKMSEIAARLCVDKQLNKEFWFKSTSGYALNSIIAEIGAIARQGPLSEAEMKKFR